MIKHCLSFRSIAFIALYGAIACGPVAAAEWKPAASTIITTWGESVTPDNAWREYPRPALQRKAWTNLNGLWQWAITSKGAETPQNWSGQILVPFAIEAPLSGVGRSLTPDEALWYRRSIQLSPKTGERTLLNFEAVDYQCTVFVNGKQVGSHIGGNIPFSIDVTDAAQPGENVVQVRVLDATENWQLNGKQRLRPSGIFYSRSSGIWGTVWSEQVPDCHIEKVDSLWDGSSSTLTILPALAAGEPSKKTVRIDISFGGKPIATAKGSGAIKVSIPSPQLWSPSHPNLYDLNVEMLDAAGNSIDHVASYAGLRTVGKMKGQNGNMQFTLNNKPIFQWGALDQGWWPDGFLTPPTDAAMRSDIEFLKAAGFNMMRKHAKVEPRRFYYYCDKIGMLVWQDQVSGGKNPKKWTRFAPDPEDAEWPAEAQAQWVREYQSMVDVLRNEPCIVVWTVFNECWGQHNTMELGKMAIDYDKTRLINIASGGNWWPIGDIADHHNYTNPAFPLEDNRFSNYIKVVGEFGGHGFPVPGHIWKPEVKNWGYGARPVTQEELIGRYQRSIDVLSKLKETGVAAGVYTQTTDVEGEINGLMTYDRKFKKIDAPTLKNISSRLGELE